MIANYDWEPVTYGEIKSDKMANCLISHNLSFVIKRAKIK